MPRTFDPSKHPKPDVPPKQSTRQGPTPVRVKGNMHNDSLDDISSAGIRRLCSGVTPRMARTVFPVVREQLSAFLDETLRATLHTTMTAGRTTVYRDDVLSALTEKPAEPQKPRKESRPKPQKKRKALKPPTQQRVGTYELTLICRHRKDTQLKGYLRTVELALPCAWLYLDAVASHLFLYLQSGYEFINVRGTTSVEEALRSHAPVGYKALYALLPAAFRAALPQTEQAQLAIVSVILGERYNEPWRSGRIGAVLKVKGRLFRDSELSMAARRRVWEGAGWPARLAHDEEAWLAFPMVKDLRGEPLSDSAHRHTVQSVTGYAHGIEFKLHSGARVQLNDAAIREACAGSGDFDEYDADDARKAAWIDELQESLSAGLHVQLLHDGSSFAFGRELFSRG